MPHSVKEPNVLMIQEQQVSTTVRVSQLIDDAVPTTVFVSCGSLAS